MNITIDRLPSGFYAVRVNGEWIDASARTIDAAREKAKAIVLHENKRQNAENRFTNISVNECVSCVHYQECFFSGNVCGSFKPGKEKINYGELETRGESGLYEKPRVAFTVLPV